MALAIFVTVKVINSLKRKEEGKLATPLTINEELLVLREIREELRKG